MIFSDHECKFRRSILLIVIDTIPFNLRSVYFSSTVYRSVNHELTIPIWVGKHNTVWGTTAQISPIHAHDIDFTTCLILVYDIRVGSQGDPSPVR